MVQKRVPAPKLSGYSFYDAKVNQSKHRFLSLQKSMVNYNLKEKEPHSGSAANQPFKLQSNQAFRTDA